MRAVLSTIRHKPDRWLHPVRHRRAQAIVRDRLSEGTRGPRRGARVLVMCYGNICRSPYAAAVIRRALAPLGIIVDSAGIVGPGRPVPAHAHACALRRGEDLTDHRSQLLTPQLVREASLVVVMDTAQREHVIERLGGHASAVVLLGDLDPAPILKRAVRDPYAQAEDVFEEVFTRIDRCAATLADCASATAAALSA